MRSPSLDVLKKLADYYQVSIDFLLGRTEGPAGTSPEERLEWAFQVAMKDPSFRYGTRVRGTALTPEIKRFIVEMYERATGRCLL